MRPTSPNVVVDVLGMDVDDDGDWDLSDISLSGVTHILFSLQGLFSLTLERFDTFSINLSSNAGEYF